MDPGIQKFVDDVQRHAFWDGVSEWGYTTWFVAFGLGVALLLLYLAIPAGETVPVLSPQSFVRRWLGGLSARRSRIGIAGGIILLFLCAISSQLTLDRRRGFVADQDKRYHELMKRIAAKGDREAALRAQYMYMPQGNSLMYMSAGNPAIAADYLWLTSQHYVVNSFRRGEKFELLRRFYETIVDLNPHWVEIEVNAGKVMSALEPNRDLVEKFYQKAIFANPGNLRLLEEAGRLFVVPPVNPDLHRDYSRRAAGWFQNVIDVLRKKESTPAIARRIHELQDLIGRLSVESTSYEVADEMLLKNARDPDNNKALRAASAREWLNAHSLLIASRLEKLVAAYKAGRGVFPASLKELLPQMQSDPIYRKIDEQGRPLDAFGFPIQYDPATGKVVSHGAQAKRAVQAGAIVNSLLQEWIRSHDQKPPKDLAQLRAWLRTGYFSHANPPGVAIIDAIGLDLDVVNSPFGTPWDYDAGTGRIVLPPECVGKALFRNAERLVEGE